MLKYRFCTYALIIGVCVFLGLRCERTFLPVDSSEKIDYLQGNTVARVIIKLLDRHSFAPLSNATVTIAGIGTANSDSTGAAIFDSVKAGAYLITCAKSGFESTLNNFTLSIDSNSNTVPVVNQSTDVLFMARKGAAVRGNLYYRKDKNIYPANGVIVECQLTNSSMAFQNPLVVTTSINGTFFLDNLPEYSTYTISVHPFSDGTFNYKQAGQVTLTGRAAGDTLRATDIMLEKFIDGNFIVLSSNLETFTKNDPLMFEFSEAVDVNQLGADSIQVLLSPGSTRMLVKLTWQENNRKLAITPFDGVWINGQNYTLVVRKIKSVSGKPLDNTDYLSYTFSPIITGVLGDVANFRFRVGTSDTNKVDYNTSSIYLMWSPLQNAVTYQIFQKTTSDSAWLYLASRSDTISSISTSNRFYLGGQMQFIVLGRNSSSVSSFETATVLTVRDQNPPYINRTITSSGFNHSASNYLDTINITILSGYLPEPMDTTGRPTVTVTEGGYAGAGDTLYTVDPNRCFWTWTSVSAGIMSVVIDPLQNGAYDSLKIDFRSVTDWAGNKPDTTGGAGYIQVLTRN